MRSIPRPSDRPSLHNPDSRSARESRSSSGTTGGPQLSFEDYRIDYEDLDVVDLVSQIRRRVRDTQVAEVLPEVLEERTRARVRAAVDLDEERPYELQRSLHLEGAWNVTPEDLVDSRRRGAGSLLSVFRRVARPGLKLFANLELPLYKQFKINLGIADALHELLRRTTEIEARPVASLST